MRAFVTGATGFIGRTLCALLEREGTTVLRAEANAAACVTT